MKKMQKRMTKVLAYALSLTSVVSLAACGGRETGEKVDGNRTQVYVNYYNGGLGMSWIGALKTAFEAKHPEIQIMPLPGKSTMDAGTVLNSFDSYTGDLFFMDYVGSEMQRQFKQNGYLADITKYVKTDKLSAFGENTTIWDKMTPAVKGYYDDGGSVYALPWYQASYQMIYDVALFEEKSFFVDENGDWNDGSAKSLGQDGVAGTYDDGLPETITEFFALMDKMVSEQVTPLTFYGDGAYYFTSFLTNMFADYEGYDDFMLNYLLEGTDSDLGEINVENAYQLKNGQSGKRFVLEFAQRFFNNPSYYSSNAFQTSQDNFEAQTEFLMSVENSKEGRGKRIAMLVEGPWWEKEASITMSDMAAAFNNPDYDYGKRRFGIMPMPGADDGSSAEGDTVACTSGCSLIFMNNLSSEKSKEAAGLFLQFCHSEEGLCIATQETGIMRPYSYTMTDAYLNKMTPFGKMNYNHHSRSDIVFEEVPVHPFLRGEGSAYCSYLFTMLSTEDTTVNIAKYFQPGQTGHTVDAWLAGMANDESKWRDRAEEYLFRVEE